MSQNQPANEAECRCSIPANPCRVSQPANEAERRCSIPVNPCRASQPPVRSGAPFKQLRS